MSLLLASLVVVTFAAFLERLRVGTHATKARVVAARSVSVLRDPGLTDEAKERALRRNAVELFRLGGQIVLLSALALAMPIGAVWLLDLVGAASYPEVVGVLERLDFLIAAGVVGFGVYLVSRAVSRR